MVRLPRWKHRMAWALSILAAWVFYVSGSFQLAGSGLVLEQFAAWGYPTAFAYVVGVVEVLAGLLLLVPRAAFWAGLALLAEMAGALLTHLVHAEWLFAPVPLLLGAALALVVWWRRPDWVEQNVDRRHTAPA